LDKLNSFLLVAPVLLFSMVAHEYAHGYAALKQGDTTALSLGRLTFNPLKHIDPFMTVLLPAFLYFTSGTMLGGAKPVPVNPRNYRHFKRGDIIVSLAGVATNFVIALLFAVLLVPIGMVGRALPIVAVTATIVQAMLVLGIIINMSLIAFNLIPVPPLDGSHVMKYLLPPAWALQYQRIGFFGLFVLLLLIRTPVFAMWMAPSSWFARFLLVTVERTGFLLPGVGEYIQ
jgi:Zn-dependent protease